MNAGREISFLSNHRRLKFLSQKERAGEAIEFLSNTTESFCHGGVDGKREEKNFVFVKGLKFLSREDQI